jgi:hypothetical protein
MGTVVVRYKPKPEQADENQRLVEAVFAELHETGPAGITYTTYRLADGTFVHVADVEAENPLIGMDAFAAFQAGIGERCDEGPNPQEAIMVGTYSSQPASSG